MTPGLLPHIPYAVDIVSFVLEREGTAHPLLELHLKNAGRFSAGKLPGKGEDVIDWSTPFVQGMVGEAEKRRRARSPNIPSWPR